MYQRTRVMCQVFVEHHMSPRLGQQLLHECLTVQLLLGMQKSYGKCCDDYYVYGNSTYPFGFCELTCNRCPCASNPCSVVLLAAAMPLLPLF